MNILFIVFLSDGLLDESVPADLRAQLLDDRFLGKNSLNIIIHFSNKAFAYIGQPSLLSLYTTNEEIQ